MEDMAYTVKELSQILHIGINKAYRLTRSKDFPRLMIGNKILVPKKHLEIWIKENSTHRHQ